MHDEYGGDERCFILPTRRATSTKKRRSCGGWRMAQRRWRNASAWSQEEDEDEGVEVRREEDEGAWGAVSASDSEGDEDGWLQREGRPGAVSPELLEMWRHEGGASDTAQTGRPEQVERDGRPEAGGAESAGRGMDVDVRALQFVRQLIYEREEVSIAELAHELRQQGLELDGRGHRVGRGVAVPVRQRVCRRRVCWARAVAYQRCGTETGSGTVTERVVMLI